MTLHRIFAPVPLVATAVALALPAPVHASYTVTCESRGYRYQYCSANTNGNAKLVNQTSSAPCIRGRSWGVDGGGVWVNNGCSGHFEVGGNSGGGNSGGGNNAGAAIAAGVGLAILGSIIASQDNDGGYAPAPQPYPTPYVPPYPGSGPVPGWAIGSFSGTDTWGRAQTIQINPDGAVSIRYRDGGRNRGWFSGDMLTIGNRSMPVQPMRSGISINGAYFGR